MSSEITIKADNLSKCYHVYNSPKDRLKQILYGKYKQFYREFWALHDVSFEVKKGEAFGIIGRNGAGKSTLLQLICKTLTPTTGTIETNGKIAALLELGSGFNPEFTGRENVYMNGSILGFTRKEIDNRFDEIAAFADIGDFIDQPVKIYSSGMYVRLAFAVQVCVEPNILIIDEALSVGDIFFVQKCYARIKKIIANGTTCFFVSHDTSAILNLCDKVMLLSNGETEFHGDPQEAISRYLAQIGKRKIYSKNQIQNTSNANDNNKINQNTPKDLFQNNILTSSTKRHGAKGIEIIAASITNKKGIHTLETPMLEPLNFNILLRANDHIVNPSAGIHIFDKFANLIFAAGTKQIQCPLPSLKPKQELVVTLTVTFNVQPGEYTFSLGASEPADEGPNVGFVHDRHEMLGPILVTADSTDVLPFYGIAQLPIKIEIQGIINA